MMADYALNNSTDIEALTRLQPTDLNTDGIDASGTRIWVHDVEIVNDDDSIAVKEQGSDGLWSNCSNHMVFERLTLTGV
eukprot:UN03463